MNDGVMIAFLPANDDWCRQPDPHMTLVYCGLMEQVGLGNFSEIAKTTITVARLMAGSFSLDVTGVEVWGGGQDDKVDVLTLFPTPKLLTARKLAEVWNASQHKDFKPHATVGPEGSAQGILPAKLYFDRVMAAYGPKQLIFPL